MSGVGSVIFVFTALVFFSNVPSFDAQSAKPKQKCPRRCRCFPVRVPNGSEVDCSKKKLTDLPTVPKNTITFVMQDNQLLQLLPRSFSRNKKLQNLYLYQNHIRRVHWDAFQGLNNLQTLSLFSNRISEINNGTFKDLSSLKKLYLYLNRIKSLNKQTFVGLSSLELLSLRDNRLNDIEPGTFSPLGKLDSLFLFRNNLTKLTNGMFEGLRSLKTLIIGLNRINDIEDRAFKGLSRLTELFIDNNKLERISSRMFAYLTSLKKLHIYNNAIKRIDPGSFFRLRELSFISAHHNKMHEITPGMLAGLVSLKTLHLQANRIVQIDSKSFSDLRSLRSLYLFQNKIRIILKDTFVGLEDLIELHLGFNMISEIEDGAFTELKKLTTLYLDSNKLSRISKGTLSGLYSLLDLFVYFNRISYVANNAFSDNNVLRYIAWDVPRGLRHQHRYQDVSGNSLFCDCHAKYLKRWLFKHLVIEISCFEPENLKGTSLRKLSKLVLDKCYEPRIEAEPESVTTKVGGNVQFHCVGTPAVEHMWYKNGSRILSKDGSSVTSFGTLSLSNVQNSDGGLYVCVAKNKKGFSVATVWLNIGHKPYFESSPGSAEVYSGSKIILSCEVVAEPAAKITWRKHGSELGLDEERVFQTSRGTLVILDVNLSDEGTYSCEAINKLGMISNEVDVLVKQEKQSKPHITCSSNSTATGIDDIDISGSGSGSAEEDTDDDDDDDVTTVQPILSPTTPRQR